MQQRHWILSIAWLASVAGVFCFGAWRGESSHATNGDRAVTKASGSNDSAGPADDLPPMPRDVPTVIAQAKTMLSRPTGGGLEYIRAVLPLAELDGAKVPEALAEVERTISDPKTRARYDALLLAKWAETDGAAALAYFDAKIAPGFVDNEGVRFGILREWARGNPDAAWQWYQKLPKTEKPDHPARMAASGVIQGMAETNLDAAFQHVALLDENVRNGALITIAATGGSNERRGQILEGAKNLPPAQRAEVQKSVLVNWVNYDADAAVKWLESHPDDNETTLRKTVGQQLLTVEPERGAKVLLEKTSEAEKPELYRSIAGTWANRDPVAAGAWLRSQPQGKELDPARSSFARTIVSKDPPAAIDWAKSVQDEKERDSALGYVFIYWSQKDPVAAAAALETSGLPEERVRRLKSSMKPATPR